MKRNKVSGFRFQVSGSWFQVPCFWFWVWWGVGRVGVGACRVVARKSGRW
jgi:hypothetical protein